MASAFDQLWSEITSALIEAEGRADLSDKEHLACAAIEQALASSASFRVTGRNRNYPGCSLQYDLRFSTPDSRTLFVEAKGAWPSYWQAQGNLRKYQSYLFAPLDGSARPKKSSALDLEKLALCTSRGRDHIGLLLIGSHRPSYPISRDFDKFAQLAALDTAPWIAFPPLRLPNRWFSGFALEVRLWICPANGVDEWWSRLAPRFGRDSSSPSTSGSDAGANAHNSGVAMLEQRRNSWTPALTLIVAAILLTARVAIAFLRVAKRGGGPKLTLGYRRRARRR